MNSPATNTKNLRLNHVRICFAFAAVAMLALASCSSVSSISTPTARSFTVGDPAMQQDSLKGYTGLAGARVWVRSIHSTDSVHLEVRSRDTLALRSLLINGLSLWIDPQAKQAEKFGVSFPAARAEMLRRQEEILQERRLQGDTLSVIPFDVAFWVASMSQRNNVITDTRGTRFATPQQARMFLEEDGTLVYQVSMAFAQLVKEGEKTEKFSIGVVSERHQAQLMNTGQGAQRTGATDAYGRPRQSTQPAADRQPRMGLIPVRGWIIFTIGTTGDDIPAMKEREE